MAKIGVLTFFGTTDNYGQVLQYLATQEYLNSLGHSTSLIVPKGYERTFWRRVKWKLQYYYTKITSFLHKSKKQFLSPVIFLKKSKQNYRCSRNGRKFQKDRSWSIPDVLTSLGLISFQFKSVLMMNS